SASMWKPPMRTLALSPSALMLIPGRRTEALSPWDSMATPGARTLALSPLASMATPGARTEALSLVVGEEAVADADALSAAVAYGICVAVSGKEVDRRASNPFSAVVTSVPRRETRCSTTSAPFGPLKVQTVSCSDSEPLQVR